MPRARRTVRRRRVGRAVVGTAVVAGTAGVVHHGLDKHYAKKEAEEQQEMYVQQQMEQEQYAPPPEPVPAPAQEDDTIAQLERLAALKEQGILTEEEFAVQKAKLLGM